MVWQPLHSNILGKAMIRGGDIGTSMWISIRIRPGFRVSGVARDASNKQRRRRAREPGTILLVHLQRFHRNIMGKGIISGADVAIQLVDLREEQTWNRSGGAECDRLQCAVKVTGSKWWETNSI